MQLESDSISVEMFLGMAAVAGTVTAALIVGGVALIVGVMTQRGEMRRADREHRLGMLQVADPALAESMHEAREFFVRFGHYFVQTASSSSVDAQRAWSEQGTGITAARLRMENALTRLEVALIILGVETLVEDEQAALLEVRRGIRDRYDRSQNAAEVHERRAAAREGQALAISGPEVTRDLVRASAKALNALEPPAPRRRWWTLGRAPRG